MSRHEDITCNVCETRGIESLRFKCLVCRDYDLCTKCFYANLSTYPHLVSHPVQCVPTTVELEHLYCGTGESKLTDFRCFSCPYCSQLGFTEDTLLTHCQEQHHGDTSTVLCPICPTWDLAQNNHSSFLAEHIESNHIKAPNAGSTTSEMIMTNTASEEVFSTRRLRGHRTPADQRNPERIRTEVHQLTTSELLSMSGMDAEDLRHYLPHLEEVLTSLRQSGTEPYTRNQSTIESQLHQVKETSEPGLCSLKAESLTGEALESATSSSPRLLYRNVDAILDDLFPTERPDQTETVALALGFVELMLSRQPEDDDESTDSSSDDEPSPASGTSSPPD